MIRHRIRVSEFQPFRSREGKDTVLALQFPYDPQLITTLKAAFRAVRDGHGRCRENVGGWLPEYRVWFCEWFAWPTVRRLLVSAGYHPDEEQAAAGAADL